MNFIFIMKSGQTLYFVQVNFNIHLVNYVPTEKCFRINIKALAG
jgi:hypothetical protein